MNKPNEVLLRLHGITPPADLGIEVNKRDDDVLRKLHEQKGILPGHKVLETDSFKDPSWRLDEVFDHLAAAGYLLTNLNVELRPGKKMGSFKPVLSLNFAQSDQTTCTVEQMAWVQQLLAKASYGLAQAYLNPRADGSAQLSFDCAQSERFLPEQSVLPVKRLLGQTSNLSAQTATV